MCKLVEDYANMRAAEEAEKAEGNSPKGICNGLADRKRGTSGKAFNKGIRKNCG